VFEARHDAQKAEVELIFFLEQLEVPLLNIQARKNETPGNRPKGFITPDQIQKDWLSGALEKRLAGYPTPDDPSHMFGRE
jgi:hypothetical protein